MNPKQKIKPYEFFEPVKVFIAILLAAIVWLLPIVIPQEEDSQSKELKLVSPFILSKVDAAWSCLDNPRCIALVCAEKIPGGGCARYEEKCICNETDQPPTISHTLNCSNPGWGDWCIGTLSLDLAASDPQGQSVVISGSIYGVPFACPSGQTTCSVPLPEGTGTANYKVDSAAGLSASESASWKLDTTTPQIQGNVNGSSGTNGWYISQTSVTASASDVLSGVASFQVNVDGSGWDSYADTTFNDGIHTIQFQATDNAGNFTQTAVQSINVDTTAPDLNVSTTGTSGQNGWYISTVTLSPEASDSGSGLASFQATTDGATWFPVTEPITLNDGIYTVQFQAVDQAGNMTQTTSQQIFVDTTTPSLSLNTSGTKGKNDWYKSSVTVTPVVSDTGSGIALLEGVTDEGTWTTIDHLSFNDGIHTYQIIATDMAGNSTTTPLLTVKVDTIAPAIAMDGEIILGQTLFFSLEDPKPGDEVQSGLRINRTVIEDDDEKYKKVVWLEDISGNKLRGEVLWDGIFADGTRAAPGEYMITLKIGDAAGNETMRTTLVKVNELTLLLPIPEFVPPPSSTLDPNLLPDEWNEDALQFGGSNNGETGSETTTVAKGEVGAAIHTGAGSSSSFNSGNESTSSPLSNPNILWGGAALAMLGATLADWQKKREEERIANLEAIREREQERAHLGYLNAAYQAKLDREKAQSQGASQAAKNAYMAGEKASSAQSVNQKAQAALDAYHSGEKASAAQSAYQKAVQASADVYHASEKAYVVQQVAQKADEKSWWDKTVDWIDSNQKATSIGVGSIVGLAAIAITLAVVGTVTLPVLLVAAGVAAIAAGVTVATGTVALNNYYDRPLSTNVLDNVKAAASTAAIVSGVGLFVVGGVLTQVMIVAGNVVSGACIANPSVCANAGVFMNAVDTLEEVALNVQLAIETATSNPHAGETAIELQLEYMDGGVPGNSVAAELGEQLAKLSDDVPELIAKYGDEIVPLLLKYQDAALDIIGSYSDEGIALLKLYGDDAVEFVEQAQRFGVDPTDILSAPPKPGQSLTGWLLKIDDIKNPVNKPTTLNLGKEEIQNLVNISTHRTDSNEFVIGFYDRNKVNGYIELAQSRNASYLSMENSLFTDRGFSTDTGDFWQVNQQVLLNAVEERKTFVLNNKYDNIKTDTNLWAEVQLILQDGNGYRFIDGGNDGYDMLVPIESIQ